MFPNFSFPNSKSNSNGFRTDDFQESSNTLGIGYGSELQKIKEISNHF
jgi:hypothetical protein